MSCLSWNCRWLGNPQTKDELVAMVHNKDPKLVFLMETKVEKVVLERIGRKIQFSNLFVVPRHSIGGGLALYWPADMNVDVQTFSVRHIDAIIDLGVNDAWPFTGFYGDPEIANQESSWSLLRLLSQRFNLPWVWMGDFNEILFAEEK